VYPVRKPACAAVGVRLPVGACIAPRCRPPARRSYTVGTRRAVRFDERLWGSLFPESFCEVLYAYSGPGEFLS
jgi:hypothetical protein